MTSVKAKLKVVLQANNTVVAEAEDPVLWQRVLAAINQSQSTPAKQSVTESLADVAAPPALDTAASAKAGAGTNNALSKFAQTIGVNQDLIVGACAPDNEAPYLTLDAHSWEKAKESLPQRGPASIPPIALAGTLLALWFRDAGLGLPTQAQIQKVLATISLRDSNAIRGLSSAEWLQARPGGSVGINPARVSRAIAIARSFCTGDWSGVPGKANHKEM